MTTPDAAKKIAQPKPGSKLDALRNMRAENVKPKPTAKQAKIAKLKEAAGLKPQAEAPAEAAKPETAMSSKTKKSAKAKARTAVKGKTEVRPGSKLALVVGLLKRPNGCTAADVMKATDWPSVSMPQQAKAAGLKLSKSKDGKVTRYRAA